MMSSGEYEDIKALQKRINLNINELEVKVKQHKLICHYYGQESDKMFVQHLIQSHYGEIVYHINQIRHHLEQINSHRKALEELDTNARVNCTKSMELIENESQHQDDTPIKRTEEIRLRSKMRRTTRASSLKHVQQWENMLEEQKGKNLLNVVKRKWKSQDVLDATEVSSGETPDNDVSKAMVKNRIEKFEGFNKPKRASSTVEAFLDLNAEKDNFTRRSVIMEDVVREARRSHGFGDYNVPNKNSLVKDKQKELGNKEITTEELQESKVKNEETVESTEYETEEEEEEEEAEEEEEDVLEEIKSSDNISLNASSEDLTDDLREPAQKIQTNKTNVTTKPKIVGIHLKQSPTDN